MQAVVDFIVRNLLALWPIARVYEWQVAILVRGGRIVRALRPGLHWRWLFIDEVKTWPGNETSIDLGSGAVTTSDEQSITVSANCRYRVVDMVLFYRSLWDSTNALSRNLLGLLCTHCASLAWGDLYENRVGLEATILARVNETTSKWGVLITAVHLTDLVRSSARHHYTDGSLRRAE